MSREVHRKRQATWRDLLLPVPHLLAPLLEHPLANPHQESRFFRHWNEVRGHEQTALWMLPAHQCLGGADLPPIGQRDDRLVVHPQLTAVERLVQVALELEPPE